MPKYILQLDDKFMEWSTIVDAPVTGVMTREEFVEWYKQVYGVFSESQLEERMERVDRKGTSSIDHKDADDVIRNNRAGPGETCLTKEEILKAYSL